MRIREVHVTRRTYVWNRATGTEYPDHFRAGDRHLTAVLVFEGYAYNGGLLHALEGLTDEELDATVAGLRYFALPEYVQVVNTMRERTRALDPDDLAAGEALEEACNDAFDEIIGEGEPPLEVAFRTRFKEDPEAFAPVPATARAQIRLNRLLRRG